MSHLTEESGLGDCMACFSNIENYHLLPDEESQKIVNNCWNYLHENIANSKLQNVKSENGNELPLCQKCFEAASELVQLSEVVIKSEKKISNLSFEFSLGVLARRTQFQTVNNLPDGQISPKDFILLDVSGISPSLFSTDPTNPTDADDFAHPCENNFIGMDAELNQTQYTFEFVKHESIDVDEESADSEDDTNIPKDEELPVRTRLVVVLKSLKEANVSKKFNSNTNSCPQQPDVTNRKHQLRNESSKKKIGQSSSSNIIHRKTGNGNLKRGKQSVSSRKVCGRVDTEQNQHKCQECEKVFTSSSHLKNHTQVHTGEKPYECSFCAKTFARFSNMQNHLRIHTGEKPFKCAHCTKSFVRLFTLRLHENTHTGEKPFKCSFCTKAFGQAWNLKNHIRIHTEEKPFKCVHCAKSFAQSSDKQRHEKIHTGEKPYKCSFCTKAFVQLTNWQTHVRIHTGEKPYKCFHCTKTFARSDTLKCHQRVHTREKTP